MINIVGVSKSFEKDGQKIDAVKDLSLEIQDGEFVALIGRADVASRPFST